LNATALDLPRPYASFGFARMKASRLLPIDARANDAFQVE
jgi:hypothetical protein